MYLCVQAEKLEHYKTKYILTTEQEAVQIAKADTIVLKKQLEREKSTFNEA